MACRALLLGVLWMPSTALALDAEEARALDAVVRLDADGRSGAGLVLRRVGSGLVVVTAAHVVDGAASVRAQLRPFPGVWMKAEALERFSDRDADVAVVRVELAPEVLAAVPSFDLAATDLDEGPLADDGVKLVGQPSFEGWFVSPTVEVQKVTGTALRLHYRCDDGMSGGGVFDASWRLVGMTQRRATAQVCEAIPVPRLRQILAGWGLETTWRLIAGRPVAGRPVVGRPAAEMASMTIAVQKVTSPASSSLGSRPSTLSGDRVASILSEALPMPTGAGIRFVAGRSDVPRLALELASYDTRQVSASAYGVHVRTDLFVASFRVVLRSERGAKLFTRTYPPVEVADHEGARGWAESGRAPLAELLAEAAPPILSDLVEPELLSSLRSGGT